MHEALAVDGRQPVPADVEVDEAESVVHVVVVAQLLDLVAGQVEPEQRLGHEGVVEPLQRVVGHVEPLQRVLGRQEAVDVLQKIVVQAEGLKKRTNKGHSSISAKACPWRIQSGIPRVIRLLPFVWKEGRKEGR